LKTYKHLYPQIASFENLLLAFCKARRGKRSRPDVAEFEFHLEANLLKLQTALQNETYRPGRYHSFNITDPKPRLISAAPFKDRVVHHALCKLIEPVFERGFIFDSYANRKGKGTHAALDRAQAFSQKYAYVLKCDIEHFFLRIDHQLLFAQLAHRLADPQTLRLCRLILDSGAGIHRDIPPAFFPGDDLFCALRPRGLPIGNLTSQFWANVYLNEFDHFIKRELKCPAYCRYVDDFLLFSNSKAELHRWRARIIAALTSLRLTLHQNEAQVFPTITGIPFLGWRIYPQYRLLRKRNGLAFQRRYAQMRRDYVGGKLSFDRLDAGVQGWIAHVRHGNTWGLRRSLLSAPLPPRSVLELNVELGDGL
jgi:retron-type reverse transcriptase